MTSTSYPRRAPEVPIERVSYTAAESSLALNLARFQIRPAGARGLRSLMSDCVCCGAERRWYCRAAGGVMLGCSQPTHMHE